MTTTEVLEITGMVFAASAAVLLLQVSCWHSYLEGKAHYLKTRKWLLMVAIGLPLFAVVHLGISRFFGDDVSLAKVIAASAGSIWVAMLCLWGHHIAARWRGFAG
ncbi:MAG: hypothetical protein ACAH88_21695 [Roseimicrobium sp.]